MKKYERSVEAPLRAEASAAYGELCERVYKLPERHFGLLDRVQLDVLLRLLAEKSPERLLDVGCGVGVLTERLAAATGARTFGVDRSAASIERAHLRARERVEPRPELTFYAADVAALDLPEASFDAIVAVDVLAFFDDPDGVLERLARSLSPEGQLLILTSERVPGGVPDTRLRTATEKALERLGLAVEAIDFTARELEIWRRRSRELAELRQAFTAEGNADLHALLDEETVRCRAWAEAGEIRRMLYRGRNRGRKCSIGRTGSRAAARRRSRSWG